MTSSSTKHSARNTLTLVSLLLLTPLGCEEGSPATPDEPAPQSPAATATSQVEAPAADTASPTPEAEPTAEELAETSPPGVGSNEAMPPGKPTDSASGKATGPVAGKPWNAVASASAEKGYKCNDAYPHKFIASGGTNVDYPSKKTRGGCSGTKAVSVTIPYIAKAAGPGTVSGTLRYGICDEGKTNCRVIKKPVTLAFNAAAQ